MTTLLYKNLTNKLIINQFIFSSKSLCSSTKLNENKKFRQKKSFIYRSYVKGLFEDEFETFNDNNKSLKNLKSSPNSILGDIYHNQDIEYGTKKFYRGKVKAAIFDWGGTVVDCGVCAPILTYVELFKEEGVDITEDEARGPMGLDSNKHIEAILQKESVRRRWNKSKNQNPSKEDIERMVQKFIPQVLSSLQKYSNVIEGVSDTVKILRAHPFNLKIGSTTGYPSKVLNVLLNASSGQGFVPDSSVCLSDVPPVKPNAFLIWSCATKLQVQPIESIVKVDDSVNGIHEAILAGCWSVGVARTSSYVGLTENQLEEINSNELKHRIQKAYRRLSNSGAHYVIESIHELPQVVNDINRRLALGEKP